MKKTLLVLGILSISFSTFATDFTVTSKSIENGKPISNEFFANAFGCNGGNELPDLEWNNVPKGTKSFALSYFDMDAPTGSGFWHYSLYDIPSDVNQLKGGVNAGPLPMGSKEGLTDLGKAGFIGSCPQAGEIHRYQYKLTALDIAKLPVDKNATPQIVSLNVLAHKIEQTTLTVLAGR